MSDLLTDWTYRPIDELMESIIDYRGKSPQKTSSGVPLVTAKVVKDGRILPFEEFIAPNDYGAWMRRGLPKPGDVVVTTEAPLGEVAQLPAQQVALAQRIILLRGLPGVLNNRYLLFAMQSPYVKRQLAARATGTTVLGISQAGLRRVELPLPSFPEQSSIATVLGALDDKIEVNRRMNDTLEQIAATIVTRGSTTTRILNDLVELERRTVDPGRHPDVEYEHFSMPAFDDGRRPVRQRGKEIKSQKFVVPEQALLLSKLNPRIPRLWMPDLSITVNPVASTEWLVLRPKGEWRAVLYATLGTASFRSGLAMRVTGTTGSHQRVRPEDVLSMKLPWPVDVAARERDVASHYQLCAANWRESSSLTALRETLLPALISGKLRIAEADQLVEATT